MPETGAKPESSVPPESIRDKGPIIIPWHRLFGLMLEDYLGSCGFSVNLEVDLSLKRQFVDVVVVEAQDQTPDLSQVCDGFETLAGHNLISYKSGHESLTAWVLEELIGHYVNYHKILEDRKIHHFPIRLYAVSTRFPRDLFDMVPVHKVKPGVYEIQVLSRQIRILVLSELALNQRNAVLAFFSFDAHKVKYALDHYHWQLKDIPQLINHLLQKYMLEGLNMPYTMKDFRREYILAYLPELPAEEILARFNAQYRLRGLPVEDRLRGLPVEDRLRGLPVDEVLTKYGVEDRLKGLGPKERLKGLSSDEIFSLFDQKEIEAFLSRKRKKSKPSRQT